MNENQAGLLAPQNEEEASAIMQLLQWLRSDSLLGDRAQPPRTPGSVLMMAPPGSESVSPQISPQTSPPGTSLPKPWYP